LAQQQVAEVVAVVRRQVRLQLGPIMEGRAQAGDKAQVEQVLAVKASLS
jgi:hypothetical protein